MPGGGSSDSALSQTGDANVGPTPKALREVAGLFLRLGVTAFGGPASHIAMMRDEVVRRRRLLAPLAVRL